MKANLRDSLQSFIKTKYSRPVLIAVIIILAAASITAAIVSAGGDRETKQRLFKVSENGEKEKDGIILDWSEESVWLSDNGTASKKLNARLKDGELTGAKLTFSSDDTDIAEVDNDGNITAKSPGTAVITVTAQNGSQKAENDATLHVMQHVKGLYLPKTTITLHMGSAGELLEYRITPDNASDKTVKWTSKDEKIATVDSDGHVRPAGVGMTEVTATAADGSFERKCYVTVVNYSADVDSVTIENEYKNDAYLLAGETLKAIASVSPANARNKQLKWESSDSNVAAVSKSGKITALSPGKAVITALAANGVQDVLYLTVQPAAVQSSSYANNTTVTNGSVTYTPYDISLSELVDIQMGLNPPPKYDGATKLASREQTQEYMDPNSYCTGAYKYQFLDLSYSNGISEAALNSFLADKGVMRGHAADFIESARTYNVSEIYLAAHACLETGNGTSALSRGIEVNGQTVYNMFGIGAYDNSAEYSGSRRAYELGWTSVSAAIKGGAKWISEHYINSSECRQNTLYKMLWNPGNPGQHQYATDIGWATHQGVNIEKIFRMFPEAVKAYDVPVYTDTVPPQIQTD